MALQQITSSPSTKITASDGNKIDDGGPATQKSVRK